MNTTVNEAINQGLNVKAEPKTEAKPIDFGKGKYSNIAEVEFNKAKFYLVIDDKHAEKYARAYASDLGRLNVNIDKISLGAFDKEGYITIRESGKSAKIKGTDSMRLAKIVSGLESLYKLGFKSLETKLEPELAKWLFE